MNTPIRIAFLIVLVINGSKGVAAIGEVGLCTLDGGALSSSGMLEVLTESGWSAVSSLGFGGLEAQVVCVQLGFTFVANVSTLSVTSRRLEIIVERITCNGTEENLSDCLLEVSENPPGTDLSLVYISCDTVHNTSDGIILFLLDNPFFMASNYPEVNSTLYTTYTMIEPSHNIYKKGCLTRVCTPGGHFYTLGSITPVFESHLLRSLRTSVNCSSRDRVPISLSEFGFIDCISTSIGNDSELQFCTNVNNVASVTQPTWLWNVIMVMIISRAVDF